MLTPLFQCQKSKIKNQNYGVAFGDLFLIHPPQADTSFLIFDI